MKKTILILLCFQYSLLSYGQCVDYSLPSSACIDQNIQVTNLSGAGDYEWDFCTGDFYSTPSAFNAGSIDNVSDNRGIDIVFDGNNWYGFATGRSSDNIVRFEFGSDIKSAPTSFDLGNVGGLLDGPEPIKIISEDDEWYGLVHNGGDESLVRLDFGNLLTNTPTATTVLNGVGGTSSKFDIGYSNDSLILVLVNFQSSSQLTIVNFSESITNIPEPDDYFTTGSISPASWTTSISLIRQCDKWYGVSENLFNGRAYLFSFGNTIFREPTAVELGSDVYGADGPTRSWVERDNNEYIIHAVMSNGNLHKINIGNDLSAPSIVSSSNLGTLSQLSRTYSFNMISDNSENYAFSTDRLSGKLIRMEFENVCNSSTEFSVEEVPPPFSYEDGGSYFVGLKVIDQNDQVIDNVFKSVTISTNVAPDINISTPYSISCINNPIEFTAVNSSGDIQSYDWDFGDGDNSTDENPTHAYATPGTYEITLNVTDPDPCDNFTTATIKIFDDPVGTFDSPSGVVCTNQQVTFVNTTPDNFEDNESFEWQIDGETVSTDRDLSYEFESGGTFEVKLITSIPGCSNETVEDFDVIAGPSPNFTVDDDCVGALFEFNNTTTGSNITSYTWDFDNGFMSSDENPEPFEYSEAGTYNVMLTTINSDGCETDIEKWLTVYELPQVDFSNELSCEQAPTQFTDLSTIDNANIEYWQWDFDDPASSENISSEQNPQHVFTRDGQFDVKLTTTSTFGCIDSVEQVVDVNLAPTANFDYDKVCLGEEVQFEDASEAVPGEVLTSWAWNIGGEFSDQQNPSTTFDFAIDYDVSLTVTSQNLCTNTLEKTIAVNEIPAVAFDVDDACNNEEVNLYDTTVPQGDPIAEYAWDFDGLGTAADSSVYFNFPESGSYDVSLGIVTDGGCEYQTQQTINVNEASEAGFEVSSAFGAPPFEVNFTNTSDAQEYHWDFGDGSTSSEANPTHTFENEGTYEVQLAIHDANGCADTTSTIINALIPDLEVELQQLTLVNNKLILTIRNNGTLVIDSLKATINLDDRATLEETVRKTLLPAVNPTAENHTLAITFTSQNIEYVCVTLDAYVDGIEDSNQTNNTKCKNFDSPIIFVNPFPNPASDILNLNIVSEASGPGTVRMVSNLGESVLESNFDGVRGRNEISLDVSNLNDGIYYIEIEMAGAKYTTRVAISN